MRADIVPGAIFPDYELSDHTATRRKLSDLQGQHPMVLVLSRGGFCPKDRRQSELLVEFHREMEVGYCRLVTISTDNITETSEYRTGVGAHWPFPLRHEACGPKRSRHRRIHRSSPQSHDSPHNCARARPRRFQGLQRILVLRSPHYRRPSPGSPRCNQKVPARLGHHRGRTQGCLAARRN